MLSISFLPWLLLLLGIVLAVPIVSFVEASRQKKAMEAAAGPAGEGAEGEGEEVFAEDAESGFGGDAGFPEADAMPADGGFGQPGDAELADFDDDAFK